MTSAKLKVAVLYDVWEDETAAVEVTEEEKTSVTQVQAEAQGADRKGRSRRDLRSSGEARP